MVRTVTKEGDDRFFGLLRSLMSVAIREEWGSKYAKFSAKHKQSLFVHAVNAFSVARKLGEMLFDLNEDETIVACVGAFFHDYQKAEPKWQEAALSFLRREGAPQDGAFDHDDGGPEAKAKLKALLEAVEGKLNSEGQKESLVTITDRVLNLVVYTHDTENRAAATRRRTQVGPADRLVPLIRLADSMASMKEPKDILNRARDLDIPAQKRVHFEYHELSVIRGLVSSFLNEALTGLMKECGYEPLLHFGKGVAYLCIGEPRQIPNFRDRLQQLISEQEDRFRASDIYKMGMTNAVIGPLTQTNWPCLQIVQTEDIPDIIRHLSAMPAMNKPAEDGKSTMANASDAEKEKIRQFLTKCGAGENKSDETLALMISDFNLFIYFADFLRNYRKYAEAAGRGSEYTKKVNALLSQHSLGFTLESMSDATNTAGLIRKLEVITILWDLDGARLHLSKDRRKQQEDRFIAIMSSVLRDFSETAPDLIPQEALSLLMTDIQHVPVGVMTSTEIKDISEETEKRYLEGKDQKKRICSFCGAEGVKDAPATLFGDGSQRFSNLLPAGCMIGAGRKAQVCALCLVESTLRAFFFPSAPATTFVVIPDMSLSPDLAQQWAEGVAAFVRTETVGLSPAYAWNMNRVYTALVRGETIDNATALAAMLRPTNQAVDKLAKHLQAEWQSPSDLAYDVLTADVEKTFEAIAEGHLSGTIRLHPQHTEEFKTPSRTQGTAYLTPSHMFVFFRNPLYLDDKESPSTVAIRTYLLALIVSSVFHARVIVVDGFQPLSNLSMDGTVRISVPAPAQVALSCLGISGEVSLHEVREALRRLSSITLIGMSYVEGLGKDRLLRLATMNRGAILRRSELEEWSELSKSQKRRLIDLLSVLPEVSGEPSTL
ncbi:MAG: type I-D CRISPR-associated protein Cas10d/Csc3 [Candidatus Thorarchaeota archaeon]|nr:type I-D CRISPR-associated protein Cas10d/Csc3 [Candidatus Thorarchaeota archaeon]